MLIAWASGMCIRGGPLGVGIAAFIRNGPCVGGVAFIRGAPPAGGWGCRGGAKLCP